MSDAYKEYCEEQRVVERMSRAMKGVSIWNSLSNEDKLERLSELRSKFLEYEGRLLRDLSQLNIGCAKEDLVNLRCLVLNSLEYLGVV